MLDLVKNVFSAFSDLKKYVFVKGLFVGLVFSLVVTTIVALFSGVIELPNKEHGLEIHPEDWKSTFIAAGFPVVWLLSAFVSYLAMVRELDDIYTWLRKKMCGNWDFRMETWRLSEVNEWKKEYRGNPVLFNIDQKNQKLKAKMFQRDNEFFEDDDFDTGVVHIEDLGQSYRLDVLFRCEQRVRSEYRAVVKQDAFLMTLLLCLDIKDPDESKVQKMKGIWYDVDNVMWRIVSRLQTDEIVEKLYISFGDDINNYQGAVVAERVDD